MALASVKNWFITWETDRLRGREGAAVTVC